MPIHNSSIIHSNSLIEENAIIGKNCKVGPYCYVSSDCVLEDNIELFIHVSIVGKTLIGKNTKVWPFASIGHYPQDLKYNGEPNELIMALVDLKSKLNQFRGENNPNNPYQKSGKRDTDLESNVDINTNPERKNLSDSVDGEGRQILGQSISTQASTFLKGLKKFGVDIPIENKYENTIKRDVFIEDRPFLQGIRNAANAFETTRKAVSNFSDDPLGSINSLANIDQETKLIEYRSKAYGKFKNYGSQGKDVINRGSEHRKVSETFEGPVKGDKGTSNVNRTNLTRYGTCLLYTSDAADE